MRELCVVNSWSLPRLFNWPCQTSFSESSFKQITFNLPSQRSEAWLGLSVDSSREGQKQLSSVENAKYKGCLDHRPQVSAFIPHSLCEWNTTERQVQTTSARTKSRILTIQEITHLHIRLASSNVSIIMQNYISKQQPFTATLPLYVSNNLLKFNE